MTDANTQPHHSASDLGLLESGYFADVTVVCGAKSWKLHKLILCSRNKFFYQALTGDHQEAADRVVKFDDDEPEIIDLAVTYIYGGGQPQQ
ncbi:hypothetical protein SLS63_012017 [Diaporthe eres]|uniref:BTB domain-containing protein n=1 Tax=Diaporthe eres TaxID=83184 RepID=A0ABR1NSF9_DIAER